MARQQKLDAAATAAADPAPRKSLFDQVAGWLDANDWTYTASEEKRYFSFGCQLKEANVRVILDTREEETWRRVLGYVVYPVRVPEARRPDVLEAINRINHALAFGSLEMDMSDGELRIRTVAEGEREIADAAIDRVLSGNLNVAERHFGALMAVIFGGAKADTVLELADAPAQKVLQ